MKLLLMVVLSAVVSCPLCHAQDIDALNDSLRIATEALDVHPDSVDLRLKKAGWNLQLEQWQHARAEYDMVLEQFPDNIAALYFRAYANEKLKRYNFARVDYEALLRIVPEHFEGRLGLALLNQKDKHFTEALDQINQLAVACPDSAIVFAVRAGMEQERGLLELAELDYSKAIELEPLNNDYRFSRLEISLKLGKLDDARAELDELARLGVPRGALQGYYRRLKKR